MLLCFQCVSNINTINTANFPQVLSSTIFCNYCNNIMSAVIAYTVWMCFSVPCRHKIDIFLWVKTESGAHLNNCCRTVFFFLPFSIILHKWYTNWRIFKAPDLYIACLNIQLMCLNPLKGQGSFIQFTNSSVS